MRSEAEIEGRIKWHREWLEVLIDESLDSLETAVNHRHTVIWISKVIDELEWVIGREQQIKESAEAESVEELS